MLDDSLLDLTTMENLRYFSLKLTSWTEPENDIDADVIIVPPACLKYLELGDSHDRVPVSFQVNLDQCPSLRSVAIHGRLSTHLFSNILSSAAYSDLRSLTLFQGIVFKDPLDLRGFSRLESLDIDSISDIPAFPSGACIRTPPSLIKLYLLEVTSAANLLTDVEIASLENLDISRLSLTTADINHLFPPLEATSGPSIVDSPRLLSLSIHYNQPAEAVMASAAKARCFPLLKEFHTSLDIRDPLTLAPLPSACSALGDFIFKHASSLKELDIQLDWSLCLHRVPELKGKLWAAWLFDASITTSSILRGLTAATKLERLTIPVWSLSPRAPLFGHLGTALRNIRELHLQPGNTELFKQVTI
jgi:hypothetical protein